MTNLRVPFTVALTVAALGLAACGGDDGDETTAQGAAKENAQSASPDLDRFLMRNGEEPGFRQGAAPGAMPAERVSISGVEAFAAEMQLTPADTQRLARTGFVSWTVQPIRGPRSAGLSGVNLYESVQGAKQDLAHELRPSVIRSNGPVAGLRFFRVPGIPSARGWTASEPPVGNVLWVEGPCMLVLGNQGPGPFVGPLSEGARAIYERTNGKCP
jgi:hypothetical protein